MTSVSMVIDNDNASETEKWLMQCKDMIRSKMAQNIDNRATETENVTNEFINTFIKDTKSNISLNVFPFSLYSLQNAAKEELYAKVNNWKGLCNFKTKSRDFKSYKANTNGWWNRHASQWIGDYFLYPLLHNTLPQYIRTIVRLNDMNTSPYYATNPVKEVTYALIYFSVLYNLFHKEIKFVKSKDKPLILEQCFLPKKCKNTLQQLFITLGDHEHYKVPWNLDHNIKKAPIAANYARKWAGDILSKTKSDYQQIMKKHSVVAVVQTEQKLEAYGVIITDQDTTNNCQQKHTKTLFKYKQRIVSPKPISLPPPSSFDDNKSNYYNQMTPPPPQFDNNFLIQTTPPPLFLPPIIHIPTPSHYKNNNNNQCVCDMPPVAPDNTVSNPNVFNVQQQQVRNNLHLQYRHKPGPFSYRKRRKIQHMNQAVNPHYGSHSSQAPSYGSYTNNNNNTGNIIPITPSLSYTAASVEASASDNILPSIISNDYIRLPSVSNTLSTACYNNDNSLDNTMEDSSMTMFDINDDDFNMLPHFEYEEDTIYNVD